MLHGSFWYSQYPTIPSTLTVATVIAARTKVFERIVRIMNWTRGRHDRAGFDGSLPCSDGMYVRSIILILYYEMKKVLPKKVIAKGMPKWISSTVVGSSDPYLAARSMAALARLVS